MVTIDILLVEDDPCLRAMLSLELEEEGHRVEDFSSAEAALAQVQPAADLAIVDYGLPGMDGLALLGRLRRRCPDLPVLIISSHHPPWEGIGRARFLGKPFYREQLLWEIEALLN
ncbi:MAG: response regulator [Candidatus Competibacteraceae bacterium]|nr:response regulator [Candidatus Competibacteraceae bacterium]